MPGYVIHLAVGKEYAKYNELKNIKEFEKGIIAPDLMVNVSKEESHYGPDSGNPNLNKFIKANGIISNYNEGYFLHLITDYLFYSKFLNGWDKSIYDDYDKLNSAVIKKYGIIVPKEVEEIVKFKTGKPKFLDEKKIFEFIARVGKINIRKIVKENSDVQEKISKEYDI